MSSGPLSHDPHPGLTLPGFAEPAQWLAVPSGLAKLGIGRVTGPDGAQALCLNYDFGTGAGFVVARREFDLPMPPAWEASFFLRGASPANTLEIKVVDSAGTSVWRWSQAELSPPEEWKEYRVASRDFDFAWGPAGGGSIARTSAIEIGVVAGPGGKGHLEIANFHFIDRNPQLGVRLEASSEVDGHVADRALDADAATSWRSAAGTGPHTLVFRFNDARDLGGLVVHWDPEALPHLYRIETIGDGEMWTTAFDASAVTLPSSFIALKTDRIRQLRLVATAADPAAGVGVIQVDLKPVEWSRTTAEFLTNIAIASRRGAWPRYLLREQTYWTPVATPRSGPVGLLNDDGAVEIGEGGFMLEPSLLLPLNDPARDATLRWGDRRWLTWADVERSTALADDALPVASVRWSVPELTLEVLAVAEDHDDGDRILVRYVVANSTTHAQELTLVVAARPMQVTPPWQAYRGLGGPSPISRIDCEDHGMLINGSVHVRALTATRCAGAACFDEGGLAGSLARGELPPATCAEDRSGHAEGAFAFDLQLAPSARAEVFVECRLPASRSALWTGCDAGRCDEPLPSRDPAHSAEHRIDAALADWRAALPSVGTLEGPDVAVAARRGSVTAIGHVLSCRDGAALQPGPRRYTRSWIRDGAIMAAALLRAGRADAARAFVRWYAPFQREDGFVPCCVDRSGVDPLVEHDSHGQLIYAVAEIYRFTRDAALARELWPHCVRAAVFIEKLRAERHTAEFQSGPRRNCYGLLPESVSHEGYLAQPVHSYWDDFWALRGLRDAAYLARETGLGPDAEKWNAAAASLSAAICESMQLVTEERKLPTVPSSVEWADFDPTAVAGAISLTGAGELFPADALGRTFDEYLRGARKRYGATASWNNYSPYEVRIIGALVHMGRRDDANELLAAMLAGRRPESWHQWPEIVWRMPTSPAHLGDLPHCWIGAEYAIALRTMIAYEREHDGALVIGAGLSRAWLDGPTPFRVRGLPTWYGSLDLSIEREGSGYRLKTGGAAKPPGGIVNALPE